MANDWFRFKQFAIHQDRCAMKVSTDACIQGALAAAYCAATGKTRALDIGAGTGLLSLMLAQQNSALTTDALELDEAAFEQAAENCQASPWPGRIRLHHTALQDFNPPLLYDFIICNPPFFHNHLQAAQQQRNQARHSITLTKAALAAALQRLLDTPGSACILYPASEWPAWHETALEHGLHLQKLTRVIPMPGKACNRIIGWYGKAAPADHVPDEELVIYAAPQTYTPAFTALLHPFYLYL